MPVTLYLAIPCYNEAAVLPETARRLREKFTALRTAGTIGPLSRICMIDDGSKDETWQIISDLHAQDPVFSGIRLSRNRGHQNALLCGLMTLRDRADCVISMDADLQDDINAIDAMLAAFRDGNDIVYGVRASRKQDSAFKRVSAQGYYRLLRALGADVVYNHADYRLMSRRALDALAEYKEVNLFLRGLVPLVGYPSTVVYYERGKRFAGESKYPLQDALVRVGGRVVADGVAAAAHHAHRRCDVPCQHCHAHLFSRALFYRPYRRRLVEPCRVHLGHRRAAAAGHRRGGGVHRQDLSRDEGAPPLPDRDGAR